MASRAVTLQHAVTVTEHFDAVVAVKAAAFGVGDAFIGLRAACSARAAEVRWRRPERPAGWNRSVIRGVKGQQILRLRRQTGPGGIASDIQRRSHRCGHSVRAKIGGGGTALAVLMVNRDA